MRNDWWIGLTWVTLLSCLLGAGPASIFDDDSSLPPSAPPTAAGPATPSNPTLFPPKLVGTSPASDPPNPAAVGALSVPGSKKLPRPEVERCELVMRKVRIIYGKEYARTDPSGKRDLARTMLAEAGKIQKNFDARYVLLDEARVLSAAVADASTCRQAIEQLDQGYAVEAAALTNEVLLKLLPRGGSDEALTTWGLDELEQSMAREEYPAAAKLMRVLSAPVAQSKDPASQARLKHSQATMNEYTRIAPSLARLKGAPEDPAANAAAGRFYCFVRDDWAKGLPMLAKGSDATLKAKAIRDLAEPIDPRAQFELGHQWWDAGTDNTTAQRALHARAAYWYSKALPGLTDELDRVLAKKRLEEVQAQASIRSQPPGVVDVGTRNVFIGLWDKKTMRGGIQFRIDPDGNAQYLNNGSPGEKGRWGLKDEKLIIAWQGGEIDTYEPPVNEVIRGKGGTKSVPLLATRHSEATPSR